MAKNKDPAFMFYPSDFMIGTFLMTDEEVGKYIRLLCLQHQQGHFSKADFTALGGDNAKISAKFVTDEEGLYYNVRLDEEIIKRDTYKEKQRRNGSLGAKSRSEARLKQCLSSAKATLKQGLSTRVENENINENINVNSNKTIKHKYGSYNNVLLSDDELEKLKTEFPDYKERIERLSEYIASSGKSYKSHLATIRSWARKEPPKPIMKEKSFDVDKSFETALKRSYGDLKPLAK